MGCFDFLTILIASICCKPVNSFSTWKTKLTVSNVLFNISTGIYSNMDDYVSFERLQSVLFRKKLYLSLTAHKISEKHSEIV